MHLNVISRVSFIIQPSSVSSNILVCFHEEVRSDFDSSKKQELVTTLISLALYISIGINVNNRIILVNAYSFIGNPSKGSALYFLGYVIFSTGHSSQFSLGNVLMDCHNVSFETFIELSNCIIMCFFIYTSSYVRQQKKLLSA